MALSTLAPELRREIQIAGLAPGKIFPGQKPGSDGRFADTRRHTHPGYDPPSLSLLRVSKDVYESSWDILLRYNTVVIGEGDAQDTAQWIDHLPEHSWKLIKHVEILFTWDDLHGPDFVALKSGFFSALRASGEYQNTTRRQREARMHEVHANEVSNIWHSKFGLIYHLELTSLLLDFRQAECRNRCCTPHLQCRTATNWRLMHGRPQRFNVLARTLRIKRKIKRVLASAIVKEDPVSVDHGQATITHGEASDTTGETLNMNGAVQPAQQDPSALDTVHPSTSPGSTDSHPQLLEPSTDSSTSAGPASTNQGHEHPGEDEPVNEEERDK